MDMLKSPRRDMALVFFAALLFFAAGLGVRPYLTPSEARYIEIPRQMLATGDWLTPRINGVPYFEKPALFYWLQASVMQFFGTGEFAGRIMTAILSALTCAVTYTLATLLYGKRAGTLAALQRPRARRRRARGRAVQGRHPRHRRPDHDARQRPKKQPAVDFRSLNPRIDPASRGFSAKSPPTRR